MSTEARDQLIAEAEAWTGDGVTATLILGLADELRYAISSPPVTVSDEELLLTFDEARDEFYTDEDLISADWNRAQLLHGLRAVLALVSPAAVPDEEKRLRAVIEHAAERLTTNRAGRIREAYLILTAALSAPKGNTPT